MDKEILDIIKENSNILLNEVTDSNDISFTQKVLSKLIDEKYNNSLMYSVCEIHPTSSSWSSYISTFRKPGTTNISVRKTDLYPLNIKIPTGFTKEVEQDLINMYKSKAVEKVANLLRGISDDQENFYLIEYLNNNSIISNPITVNITNEGWIPYQIASKVAEITIMINKYSFKTMNTFCILPPRWAKYFLSSPNYIKTQADSESTYFVGRYGHIDFYINPIDPGRNQFNNDFNNDFQNINNDTTSEYCYVGLKDENIGVNSLIFAPYQYEIQEIVNPNTGNIDIFLYNRFSLIENPQSDLATGKKMIYKFIIQ